MSQEPDMKRFFNQIVSGITAILLGGILAFWMVAAIALVVDAWDTPTIERARYEVMWEERDNYSQEYREAMRQKYELSELDQTTNNRAVSNR